MTLSRTIEQELESPKYAHVERERRWLVAPEHCPMLDGESVLIEDRYIVGTRLRLRVMTDPRTGAVSRKLTKKYESVDPAARAIVTAYLSPAEHALLAQLPADPLTKRRHRLIHDAMDWSVDLFDGALDGLALAEVEAADAASLAACMPPAWVSEEVTADAEYDGDALARRAR